MKRRNLLLLSTALLVSGGYFAVKNHTPDDVPHDATETQSVAQNASVLSAEPVTETPPAPATETTPEQNNTQIVMPESAPAAPAGSPPLESFKPPVPEIGASAPLPEDEDDKSLWTINEERGLTHREIRKITKFCKEQFKSDRDALKKCAFDMGDEYKKTQPAPKETASPDVEVGPSW